MTRKTLQKHNVLEHQKQAKNDDYMDVEFGFDERSKANFQVCVLV